MIEADRKKVAAGVAYTIAPLNRSEIYRWRVADDPAPLQLEK